MRQQHGSVVWGEVWGSMEKKRGIHGNSRKGIDVLLLDSTF